jgi:hypothetical protein
LGPGNPPSVSAGVVAFPHAEAMRAEDLFTLLEGALANGKARQPDRIGVAVRP